MPKMPIIPAVTIPVKAIGIQLMITNSILLKKKNRIKITATKE
jgi:hypothetical protein